MKTILFTLLFPALMFSQVVVKNETDSAGSKTIRVNAAAGKTFKEADGVAKEASLYVSTGSLAYTADGVLYTTPYLSITLSGLPEGTCLKSYEDMLRVTFDDNTELELYQQSFTDCGEHLGVYVADYSIVDTDLNKFKTANIKKIALLMKNGTKEYNVKDDRKKAIKDSFILLAKTK